MIFVVGGRNQGKKRFAAECFMMPDQMAQASWQDGETAGWEDYMKGCWCSNFHLFIRRYLEGAVGPDGKGPGSARAKCSGAGSGPVDGGRGSGPISLSRAPASRASAAFSWDHAGQEVGEMEEMLLQSLFRENPHRILVTDEIGCGIVPADVFERLYREETGRICCRVAAQASQVWRVTCGLGQQLK